jgi:hypothetical protein
MFLKDLNFGIDIWLHLRFTMAFVGTFKVVLSTTLYLEIRADIDCNKNPENKDAEAHNIIIDILDGPMIF